MVSQVVEARQYRPHYLRAIDDLPHEIGPAPLWSENYLSYASFPDAGISMWLHLGRPTYDPRIWQEIAVVFLPDGTLALAKATAPAHSAENPEAAALSYRCDEPFRTWTKTFHGAARVVSPDQLVGGALTDGPAVPLSFDLRWQARGPAFDMDLSQQTWASAHYEQNCDVTGTISWDGQGPLDIAGAGLRDHSWGARDYSKVGRHCWLHARWDDGRAFMIFHLVAPSGHVLSHVTIDRGNGPTPAKLISEAPLISDLAAAGGDYVLEITSEDGPVTITADVGDVAVMSLTGESELVLGADPSPVSSHWLCEGATRFTWDGADGHGLSERTVRRTP
ncbi:DUF7065 domain-containing protein [Sporichthya polymorpha]|uniref:DUF7065 domain-containing protein n=1 Tax=Sporichthya polymorpha TaxID=35751 RepID=UPI000362848B|nr:hypothetical protein [Sporichthya polymorpha]